MIGRYVNELFNFVKSVDIVNRKIWDAVMNGSFTKFLEANKIVRSAGYLAPASKQNKIVLEDKWYAIETICRA